MLHLVFWWDKALSILKSMQSSSNSTLDHNKA